MSGMIRTNCVDNRNVHKGKGVTTGGQIFSEPGDKKWNVIVTSWDPNRCVLNGTPQPFRA